MPDRTCSIEGCNNKHLARGLCNAHYRRLRRDGDPGTADLRPAPFSRTPEQRFWSKFEKTETCWLWTAGRIAHGYGALAIGRRMVRAHVFAYKLLVGEIPAGLVLDHTCHVRHCVNPAHLRPVTRKQNNENHNGRALSSNRSSGVRGVSWSNAAGKWVTHVQGRHLGVFSSLDDAEQAAIAGRNAVFTHNDRDRS